MDLLLGLLSENPGDSFTRFALAKEYEKLGQRREAIVVFEALQADDPGYVGLYYHLGKLLELEGQSDDALAVYKKGMEMARTASDLHSWSELKGAALNLADLEDLDI